MDALRTERKLSESKRKAVLEALLERVQKPGRYIGGEIGSAVPEKPCPFEKAKSPEQGGSSAEKADGALLNFAFCFPDIYEIGMSHLGIKILYALINECEGCSCERCFEPWEDMREQLLKEELLLFSCESKTPLCDFDVIGFTLQYELSYTNVLDMLYLGGVPLLSSERQGLSPLVIAGGPCAANPEPLADFVDLFQIGEGEELMPEFLELLREHKRRGSSKEEFLLAASKLEGIYVPSLYEFSYKEDGTIGSVAAKKGAPAKIRKRAVKNLDGAFFPERIPVPFIEIVHDRATAELFRGCIRGCRFCQAGFLYRPLREKSKETVDRQARALCRNTGYDELSLVSLSTGDYSEIQPLLMKLLDWTEERRINISLPSLRMDNFSEELAQRLGSVRKSGLTFAAEAGTQRLRDVINKNITEEEILAASRLAFKRGWNTVKLYFMLGLPTERREDVEALIETALRVADEFYKNPDREKGRQLRLNVSVSPFVPKPFTPFQWEAQEKRELLEEKREYLRSRALGTKIRLSAHKVNTVFLEAVLARGDRRLCPVLLRALEKGCRLDSWDEFFDFDSWLQAFDDCGIKPEFYANRKREYSEILPWDHIDCGISKDFLIRESEKARRGETTQSCREHCAGCGADSLTGGICDAKA